MASISAYYVANENSVENHERFEMKPKKVVIYDLIFSFWNIKFV